jgi:hypothetical protein
LGKSFAQNDRLKPNSNVGEKSSEKARLILPRSGFVHEPAILISLILKIMGSTLYFWTAGTNPNILCPTTILL